MPDRKDVKDGVIAYKIAAHAGRFGQGPSARPGARRRFEHGAFRVPLERPVRTVAGSRHRTGIPRRNPAGGASKTTHFCSMCGPKFCSMRITQDVREYAAEHGLETEADIEAVLAAGMAEKSREFAEHGNRVYLPITQ